MGLFTKEEKYNRESGKFEPVREEPRELTREEQFEKPRRHPWAKAREHRREVREKERKTYNEAWEEGRLERAKKQGFQRGRTTFGDQLVRSISSPPPRRTSSTYRKKKGKKRKRKSLTDGVDFNYNELGIDFGNWKW